MRLLLGLLFLVSCAHQQATLVERPTWVHAIRTGEEALKVNHGHKIFYRRLAGSAQMNKQASCDLAVIRVEEDIKKDYPLLPRIPFSVEVLVYDTEYKDCAVTASVKSNMENHHAEMKAQNEALEKRSAELALKSEVSEDDATEILQHRSETATRFALTGMTKEEFEKFAKDKVYMNVGGSACTKSFKTESFSIHGSTHICWRGENILGYCTAKDSQCWTKVP